MIFHARVEPAATSTRPWRSSSTSAAVTRSGRPCHGAGHTVGDPAGADGVAVVLVLGVAEGGEDDALLGGHDRPKLASGADARNRGARGHGLPHQGRSGEVGELRIGWQRGLAVVGFAAPAVLVGDLAPPPIRQRPAGDDAERLERVDALLGDGAQVSPVIPISKV